MVEKNKKYKEKKEIGIEKPEKLVEKVFEEVIEKKTEKKEVLTEREKIIKEKLKREIELMKFSPKAQQKINFKAQKIKTLDAKGKITKLLDLAQVYGISFAVKVAQKLDDPYILDVFHDILAKDGFFKKFKK